MQVNTSLAGSCADIEISGLSATLESTTAGTVGVEFATDTVRIEALIKNVGAGKVPASGRVNLTLTRNGTTVASGVDVARSVASPGSSFTWRQRDQFTHLLAQKYEYRLTASVQGFTECRADRNLSATTVTEAALHPGGRPDLAVDSFRCERASSGGSVSDFVCHVMVANLGDGAAASSSTVDVRRTDNGRVLGSKNVSAADLPMPRQRKEFEIKLPAGAIPSGSFVVAAHIARVSNETNEGNNTSSSTAQINQLRLFLAAVPERVDSGGNVTLKWEVAGASTGAQIAFAGRLSGTIRNLSATGAREVCPYGTTIYTLTHPAYPGQSAQVVVPAECPKGLGFNDPALDALVANGTITEGLTREHPEITINPGYPVLRVTPTGISMLLKGVYHKEHLPGIDIKITGLAWPWVQEGTTYRVEMKKFDVDIGSDATRVAWDIVTLGLYEGVKKGIENWAENKVRSSVASSIAAELQKNLPCGGSRICYLELRPGQLDVIRCTMCARPSASGTS